MISILVDLGQQLSFPQLAGCNLPCPSFFDDLAIQLEEECNLVHNKVKISTS